MGYSEGTVKWFSELALAPGSSILDLGSQDLYLSELEALNVVNVFVRRYGDSPLEVAEFPAVIPTSEMWKRAKFSYQCVDIDERPGTVRVDLQSLQFPKNMRGLFDFVVNAGTTEHLANPLGGFAFAHFACRKGGIIAHDVPLSGYINHGLTNPTPKFWNLLRLLNEYEVVSAAIRQSPEVRSDRTYFGEELSFIEGIESMQNTSWMISIALRKTSDQAFIPPFDFPPIPVDATVALLKGSLVPFRRLWTEKESFAGIEYAMRRMRDGDFRMPRPGMMRRILRPPFLAIGRTLGIKRWPFA